MDRLIFASLYPIIKKQTDKKKIRQTDKQKKHKQKKKKRQMDKKKRKQPTKKRRQTDKKKKTNRHLRKIMGDRQRFSEGGLTISASSQK